ncbi:hypothetical protein IT084_15515 [Desulfallas sp. Bu1-1]|uniref:hypothetical protein n=1 Tax=Desulfallas sp. Bu1-1 TaxID=2787620 RepID=UPI00189CAADB|nr:hypothetical protein [Desulfallas sp. Bu1-1]MBF7084361.1 hypothetical protein [Desulfallas sp. Bu1-1]
MEDQIVNEVRKSRELILEKFNGDLSGFFKFIREEESKNSNRLARIRTIKKEIRENVLK